MATNLDIIKRALRKLRVLRGGAEPSADQASDGMQSLQSLIAETIGTGGLGRLNDVAVTTNYTAREFDRIRCDSVLLVTESGQLITDESGDPIATNTVTVALPRLITPSMYACCDYGWYDLYGWLRCDKPRPPYDRAPVVIVNQAGVPFTNMYSAYLGQWVVINGLKEQGAFPFADYFEDGFAAMLAEAISPEYGQLQVAPIITRQANRCRYMLSYRMDSARRTTATQYY